MINLLTNIKDAPPRAIPKYHLFLKEQNKFILKQYNKSFHQLGHESSGIKKLIYLLQFVDLDYLDKQVDNYDRYYYHLRFIRRDMLNIFDRVQDGKSFKFMFFRNKSNITNEYLLPIEDLNAPINLPLNTNDWNVWKRVKPLRMWANDSDILTTKIINDRVSYSRQQPNYSVELLDVIALLMKYYIWNKYQKINEPNQELVTYVPKQYFLHKYVFTDVIFDLSNVWLTNILSNVIPLTDISDVSFYLDTVYADADLQYEYLTHTYKEGFIDVWNTSRKIRDTLNPNVFLSTKTYFNGWSINDRIRYTQNSLPLPIHARYNYLRFLRDRDLVKLYLSVLALRPGLPSTKSFAIKLDYEFTRLMKTKPWHICANLETQALIETEMNSIWSTIKNLRS